MVYRDLLNMLKLEGQHRNYLIRNGMLNTSIEDNLYRTVPKNYIKRRIIAHNLSKNIIYLEYQVYSKRKILNGALIDMMVSLYQFSMKMDIYKVFQFI